MKILPSFTQKQLYRGTAVFLFIFLFVLAINTASAADITPGNPQGWVFALESGSNGSGQFVTGPGTPPAGSGSAQLVVTAGDTGSGLGLPAYGGVRLADISAMSYWSYRTSSSSPYLAPALQLTIDLDVTVNDFYDWFDQGRLVFEPYHNGSVVTGVWQQWDAINSGNAVWWATRSAATRTGCGINTPCTLNAILSAFPNAGIRASYPGIGFKAGSDWASFDGNVDAFSITISGVTDTYNFENLPVNNITQKTGHLTIQNGVDNATAGDVLVVDPGVYTERVIINKSLTLRGSGAGTDPALHTILNGATLGTGTSGIHLLAAVTNVTIEDLTIQNYALSNANYAGISGAGNNNNFTAQRVHVLNNTGGRGGLYLNGPVDTVLIDSVTAHDNQGRGIVIWNGFKTNITITNNHVRRNNCCGIELQDGTASGVTMTGNMVVDNADSGMSAIGLTSGAGVNVIANNTVRNNGRFGIEIKNPNGTGLTSGDGSILVENNTVSFTASPTMNIRDHAGIAVFRRDFYPEVGYADIPNGVVVNNNTVTGYQQLNPSAATSEGFGIVIEGNNHAVTNNTLTDNEIGIQQQGGMHPYANYTANAAGNSDQDDGRSPEYFGRGNTPVACSNIIGTNTFSGSGISIRQRVVNNGSGLVTNTDTSETFCTIQTAINDTDTDDGDTIQLQAATYAEEVTITKNLTISGDSAATTTIIPTKNTGTSGDARGWWLVNEGVVLHLSNMTFNGSGYLIWQGILHKGEGTITDVDFTEIKYNESGPHYHGNAVRALGSGPVDFTNVTMSEIGRIGIHFGSTGVSGSVVDNLTYTGKGAGNWLDYGVEFGWGAQGTVQNSQISGNRGVASVDGSTSGCILATTYFGAGTAATITNSTLSDCTTAVAIGYNNADTAAVTVKGSNIDAVDYVFSTTSDSNVLTAYANNITNFSDAGLNGAQGDINARHNWWGTYVSLPSVPTGVDADSWAFRLGAPVVSWADGADSASLLDSNGGTASLVGGDGTAVLVNHNRPTDPVNAPFGKAISADIGANQCSDFYDAFVIDGSGSYNLGLPVDAECTSTLIDNKLFEFDLIEATGAPNADGCTPDTACWNQISAIRVGDMLTSTIDIAALQGTPFTAPSRNNNDPTAVSLSSFSAANHDGWGITAVLIILLFTATGLLIIRRRQS